MSASLMMSLPSNGRPNCAASGPASVDFPLPGGPDTTTELDLVGDDGVVLVDDRHHAEFEQGAQRRARVQVTLAVGQIGMGEQHLRRAQIMIGERAFIDLYQAHLPDGRGGLQFMHGLRTAAPAKALHALGDRATRDQHDLMTFATHRRDLLGPAGDRGAVESGPVRGHQRTADLDDDAHARLRFQDCGFIAGA